MKPRSAAVAMALTLAACNAAGGREPRHATRHTARHPAVSTTTVSTTTIPDFDDPVPVTTTVPALPTPAHSPSDPYAAVPVRRIGTIRIPRLGLVHPIYEGIWLTVLDHGPGHWPGTALPGRLGNAVFPGHRVTHSHPFLDLDRLRAGDTIIFEMPYGTFTYAVRDTIIVRPTDTWVVEQHHDDEVTLIACHPKHSAAQRIVVRGVLVHSEPKEQP